MAAGARTGTKELGLDDEDKKNKTRGLKEGHGDYVEKVVVSSRLADSPCVLPPANLKRILKAQAMRDSSVTANMVPACPRPQVSIHGGGNAGGA